MKRRLSVCRLILECAYASVFSCACLSFAMHVFAKEDVTPYHVACMCAVCILSYVFREFMPNNMLAFVSHALTALAVFFLPFSAFARAFMCVCCVAVMLPGSLSYMRAGGRLSYTDNISWPSILACFVFSLFGLADDSTAFSRQMYYIVICLLTMILVRIYLSGACRYIECTTQVDGLPIGEIIRTNTRVVALIVALTLILMLTLGTWGIGDVLAMAAKEILHLVRLAVSLIIFLVTVLLTRMFGQPGISTEQTDTDYTYEQIPETSGAFATAVTWILVAAVVFGFVCFGVRLVRQFMDMLLSQRTHTADIVENRRKGETVTQKVRPQRKRIFPVTREERFRRMYMYEIERYDIALDRYKTCSDIEAEVERSGQGDVAELNELYKSVRYGGRKVDRETLRELNYLIKK